MRVSDKDHEIWYGDQTTANKMTGKELKKVFWNNLQAFIFNQSNIGTNNFNFKTWSG